MWWFFFEAEGTRSLFLLDHLQQTENNHALYGRAIYICIPGTFEALDKFVAKDVNW